MNRRGPRRRRYWPLERRWKQSPSLPDLYVSPEGDVFVNDPANLGYAVVQEVRAQLTFRHKGRTISVRNLVNEAWGHRGDIGRCFAVIHEMQRQRNG